MVRNRGFLVHRLLLFCPRLFSLLFSSLGTLLQMFHPELISCSFVPFSSVLLILLRNMPTECTFCWVLIVKWPVFGCRKCSWGHSVILVISRCDSKSGSFKTCLRIKPSREKPAEIESTPCSQSLLIPLTWSEGGRSLKEESCSRKRNGSCMERSLLTFLGVKLKIVPGIHVL